MSLFLQFEVQHYLPHEWVDIERKKAEKATGTTTIGDPVRVADNIVRPGLALGLTRYQVPIATYDASLARPSSD